MFGQETSKSAYVLAHMKLHFPTQAGSVKKRRASERERVFAQKENGFDASTHTRFDKVDPCRKKPSLAVYMVPEMPLRRGENKSSADFHINLGSAAVLEWKPAHIDIMRAFRALFP